MKKLILKVDNISKVYPHKDCDCYYNAYNFLFEPEPKEGIIGGFLDELIKLEKGKTYSIEIKEVI